MFFSDVSLSTFALLMLPAIINLWGISHATRHSFPGENERTLWVVACIFLPVLGGVLYLIFGLRRSKTINYDDNTDNDKKDDYMDDSYGISRSSDDIHIADDENNNNKNNGA